MKSKNCLFIILLHFLCFIYKSSSFNINTSSNSFTICKEAELLLDIPSFNFPRASFINFVLYGHTDTNFTYKDFLSSYMYSIDKFLYGNLVIGNDGQLGGIVLYNGNVAIPIPGGEITEVPNYLMNKFFPNGFTILETPPIVYNRLYGPENATFNGISICNTCGIILETPNSDHDLFIENNFYLKWVGSPDYSFGIGLYGYLKAFDPISIVGTIRAIMYLIYYYQKADIYNFTEENKENTYTIRKIGVYQYNIDGSIHIYINNTEGLYNFHTESFSL